MVETAAKSRPGRTGSGQVAETDGARDLARRCLAAWTSGDFERARSLLSDNVAFAGPLGAASGVDAYLDVLRRTAQIVERAEEREVFAEGDNVCIIYELITKTQARGIPTAGWYRIHDGKISEVRVFFDSRRLLQPPNRVSL